MTKEKITKLIFLDFDGVIVTQKTKYQCLDKECTDLLKKILDKTGAFIVITSTWRKHFSFMSLKELLSSYGIKGRLLGAVERIDKNKNDHRGNEISEWIDQAKSLDHLDLQKYIILDDEKFQLKDHLDHLVHTDTCSGIKEEHVAEAIRKLNESI